MISFTHFSISRTQRADLGLRDAYPIVPLCTVGLGSVASESRISQWVLDARIERQQDQSGAGIERGEPAG